MINSKPNSFCCRVCKSKELSAIHDFGKIPIADKLGTTQQEYIDTENLSVAFCTSCCHLQVIETIDPIVLFKYNYPYFSSSIPEVVSHFKDTYKSIIDKFDILSNDYIIEIAANDGVLLNNFLPHSQHLVSVEPSIEQAKITIQNGIQTYNDFFCFDLAKKIASELPKLPKLILANNVLAHVPNPDDFVKGLSILMNKESAFVLEVPHSLPMIQNNTFDVIFHQHYSYFNLKTLISLFNNHGLYINNLEKIKTQGGSLRLFISKNNYSKNIISEVLDEEQNVQLYELETYHHFSNTIKDLKAQTLTLLHQLKEEGKTIIGYGAPGKAATLLNYFGINTNYFDYIVDISPSKHHKFFPNTGLEIFPIEKLEKGGIDFVFILVWNYADSIIENLKKFNNKIVKFILIYPSLKVI